MDKKTIAIIIISLVLLASLVFNFMQSNKYNKLEKRFNGLKEVEKAECELINTQVDLIEIYNSELNFEKFNCNQDW